jgi:hypothetical protein
VARVTWAHRWPSCSGGGGVSTMGRCGARLVGSPEQRNGVRAAGRLDSGGVLVGDGSPVGNGGGGEVLEHRETNRGVRHGQKEKENSGAKELTKWGEKRRRCSYRPTRTCGQGGADGAQALLQKEKGGGEKGAAAMGQWPFYRDAARSIGGGGSGSKRCHTAGRGQGPAVVPWWSAGGGRSARLDVRWG